MIRLAAAMLVIFAASTAHARQIKPSPPAGKAACDQRYLHTCAADWKFDLRKKARRPFRASDRRAVRKAQARSHRHARMARPAAALPRGAAEARKPHQQAARLQGVVAPLAAKAAEIVSACGSRVVSAVRKTFIAGTRRISLHASGRAVDMVGNPKCMFSLLRGWPGGYSTDYGRVRHVHISYAPRGREWGTRFVHGTRHARRHRASRIGG